jgi:hypothetical protein
MQRRENSLQEEVCGIHSHFVEFPRCIFHKIEQSLSDIVAHIDLVAVSPGLDVDHRHPSVYKAEIDVNAIDYLNRVVHYFSAREIASVELNRYESVGKG